MTLTLNPLRSFALFLGGLVLLPVGVVLSGLFQDSHGALSPSGDLLWRYMSGSVALGVGVGTLSLVMGIACAWLVSMCRFPGSRLFSLTLFLPLAMPTYLVAYTYSDFLDRSGPVFTNLGSWLGIHNLWWWPEVRSIPGAICIISFVLYPYVYLLARSAFLGQCANTLSAARTLGCGPWRLFFRVALPSARPALVAGTTLVTMETLADFGAVQHLAVDTFTTGIYRRWYGFTEASRTMAVQLAAGLLCLVTLILLLERWSRGRRAYSRHRDKGSSFEPRPLGTWAAALAMATCSLPLLFGFIIPCLILITKSLTPQRGGMDLGELLTCTSNTVLLALVSATLAVGLGLALSFFKRVEPGPITKGVLRLSGMGYAVPGTVIAVGTLIPFGWFDNQIWAPLRSSMALNAPTLLLSGTAFALIYAYVVRFLAVAIGSVESNYERLGLNLDMTARSLGCRPKSLLTRVHIPLLKSGLGTAAILVFVDVIKELPATLIIRPLNFDTLAVRAHQYAELESLELAALPALLIVAVSMIPVLMWARKN